MGWTHLSDARPKARKRHRCTLCHEPIEPGEIYVRSTGVQDGELGSVAMHVECEAETESWDLGDWESYEPGEMERLIPMGAKFIPPKSGGGKGR